MLTDEFSLFQHIEKTHSPKKSKSEKDESAIAAEREAHRLKREKQEQERFKMKWVVHSLG